MGRDWGGRRQWGGSGAWGRRSKAGLGGEWGGVVGEWGGSRVGLNGTEVKLLQRRFPTRLAAR